MIWSNHDIASHYRYHNIPFYSHEPIWVMRALSILVVYFIEAQQAAGAFMNFLHASQNDSMAMVISSVDVSWKSIREVDKMAEALEGNRLAKAVEHMLQQEITKLT